MLSLLNTTFTNTLRQGFTLIGRLLSKLKARSTYFENQAGTKVILKELDSEGLLEKASIITTPTAYSDGVLHSVKPSLPTSLEPTFFSFNGNWNWDGSILSASPASGNTSFQNDIFLEKKTYIITFKVLSYVSGSLGYRFGGGAIKNNYFNSELIEGNTITLEAQSDATVNNFQFLTSDFNGSLSDITFTQLPAGDFTFTRNNIGTRVNASGNIESVGVDLPRIDYLGGCGSLLLEPEATNTATDSNDFTTGDIFEGSGNPTLSSAILTSAQAASPDGTNNAWKLVDNNDGNFGATYISYFTTDVIAYNYNTVSLFAKKQGNNDWLSVSTGGFDSPAIGQNFFNISNGTLGNVSSNHTASIDDYGNGWYRCSITFQATTDTRGSVQIKLAINNGQGSITRDGTNGVYIYGLQAEQHATRQYATSYIPTSGGTGTRGADSATGAGSSDLISSTEGVFYLEVAASTSINNFESITLSDGSTQNRIRFQLLNTLNRAAFQVQVGGVNQVYKAIDTTDITNFNKIALKYKQNDFSVWLNGVKIHTNTSGAVPTLSELSFASGDNGNPFNGNVKCVAVFEEALTDAELTALTS